MLNIGEGTYDGTADEVAFVGLVNNYRTSMGLGPVEWNASVAFVTYQYGKLVLANGAYDGSLDGLTVSDRLAANDVDFGAACETGICRNGGIQSVDCDAPEGEDGDCETGGIQASFDALQATGIFDNPANGIGVNYRADGCWVVTLTN